MNVVPFSEYDTDRQVQAHQLGLPRVILEGADDVVLFKEWFGALTEELDFVEAGDIGNAGGCTGVGPAVALSRERDGIPAVGIVDRDAVHREHKWSVVFSTDEDFFAREARTEAVYTASLWEVEAYLLQPDLLSDWVGTQLKDLPATAQQRSSALAKTLEECEALLGATPFYSASHGVGSALPAGHHLGVKHDELVANCEAQAATADEAHQTLSAEIQTLVDNIKAQAPGDVGERLVYLLRYVDTKRLLARLKTRLKLRDRAHWGLAPLMSSKAVRPHELELFLRATAERYAA